MGIQVLLTDGTHSQPIEGKQVDTDVEYRNCIEKVEGRIAKVGCKIFQAGCPEMHFHGLKLIDSEGKTLHEEDWCDLGNWKYQEIGENETLVGFHG